MHCLRHLSVVAAWPRESARVQARPLPSTLLQLHRQPLTKLLRAVSPAVHLAHKLHNGALAVVAGRRPIEHIVELGGVQKRKLHINVTQVEILI